jgi:hypothetical protein
MAPKLSTPLLAPKIDEKRLTPPANQPSQKKESHNA